MNTFSTWAWTFAYVHSKDRCLFVARELFKQLNLLILDEATSAPPGTEPERYIQRSIDALKGEVTVVIIAHRLPGRSRTWTASTSSTRAA